MESDTDIDESEHELDSNIENFIIDVKNMAHLSHQIQSNTCLRWNNIKNSGSNNSV